jgi:hypothetical protein
MRRSQEQPVMNAAYCCIMKLVSRYKVRNPTAAGGKRMATMMRRTSEPLTIVNVYMGGLSG